jgi:hypothetical protein
MMSETKKFETTRKNYTFDPARLIGSAMIAGSILGGMMIIGEAIKTIPPMAVESHVDFARGSIVVNERAVEFGAVTERYEVKRKTMKK